MERGELIDILGGVANRERRSDERKVETIQNMRNRGKGKSYQSWLKRGEVTPQTDDGRVGQGHGALLRKGKPSPCTSQPDREKCGKGQTKKRTFQARSTLLEISGGTRALRVYR